jgi:hypothetical protein
MHSCCFILSGILLFIRCAPRLSDEETLMKKKTIIPVVALFSFQCIIYFSNIDVIVGCLNLLPTVKVTRRPLH